MTEAQKMAIDMPITAAVCALSSGKLQVNEAMDMLLSRPQKEE
jgi:glycerol-3-phosphate dehydrogenase (NAD(P)+)